MKNWYKEGLGIAKPLQECAIAPIRESCLKILDLLGFVAIRVDKIFVLITSIECGLVIVPSNGEIAGVAAPMYLM